MLIERMLIESESVKFGDFTLASGAKSDIYCDCRKLIMDSRYISRVGNLMGNVVFSYFTLPYVVAGVADGGIPLVAAVLGANGFTIVRPWRGGWIRKEAKQHGAAGWLAGNLQKGDNVILLEDVVTTGDSAIKAIRRLTEAEIKVRGVVCIVDRTGEKDEERVNPFERMDVPFYSLTTLDAIRGAYGECHGE